MTKILITGATSRAASRIGESSLWAENELELITPRHSEIDVTKSDQLEEKISIIKPDYVINFAGITDLNMCEAQRDNHDGVAWQVNVEGTKNLVKLSRPHKFHLIQISTASVFAGEKENPGPYTETAEPERDPAKLSWYGFTKLAAEEEVKKNAENWTIVRLASTVRSSAQSKPCLFRRWLEQSKQGTLPPLFDDQLLSTTDLTEVDVTLALLIQKKLAGIYHVTSPNLLSPYQIAQELLQASGESSPKIQPASLIEQIQKGNTKLKLFCPVLWGLDASQTSQKIGTTFKTVEESVTQFFQKDLA